METLMLQFEMEASVRYTGSGQSALFSASSYEEVISEIKRIWYRAGLVFNRDEAFLSVYLPTENEESRVFIGTFVFDDDMHIFGTAEFHDQSPEYKIWHDLGLGFGQHEDPEWLFERILNFLFEKNTPEKLLGQWFVKLESADLNFEHIEPEQAIIAHLLKFSDDHEKLFEMYAWCLSPAGEEFFESNENFCVAARLVWDELSEITKGNFKNLRMYDDDEDEHEVTENNDNSLPTKEKIIENLRSYIRLYERPLPFELKLED
jgi:hypothetical protein